MVMFHSYVSLPEGILHNIPYYAHPIVPKIDITTVARWKGRTRRRERAETTRPRVERLRLM